jgi:site-specific DNA recombinase
MTGKRAVGYVRVSTADQAEEGKTSLQTQRERIATYCQAHGFELTKIYSDEGISGASTKKRPGFMQLLADAKAGLFDCLIIRSLTRFARNTKETIENYDLLESYGIKLVFLKENVDTSTPTGRAFRNLLAVFAEWERDTIRERMLGGRKTKWKAGKTFVGKPPFGYQWNPEKKCLEINPQEAAVYRRMVDMYVNQGMSYLDIAVRLKREGVRCKSRPFSQAAVSYIFKNPIYYGEWTVNRHSYDGNKRTGKIKPEDEHITIKAPALISKTMWDKIKAKREFNRIKGKRLTQSRDHWLRDLLVCELCGGPVKPHTNINKKSGSKYRYYSCNYRRISAKGLENLGRRRCFLPTIKAEEIEEQIWEDIVNTLTYGGFTIGHYHPSKLEEVIGAAKYEKQIASLEDVLQHQESELRGKEWARERLMGLLESDDFDETEFRQRLAQVKTEVITIRAAIEDTKAKIQSLQEARANNEEFANFVRNNQSWLAGLREELNNLAPDDKKLLVESLVPGKIPVWWVTLEELETGPAWGLGAYPWSFNTAIFERLASEGKLTRLTQNDRNHRFVQVL